MNDAFLRQEKRPYMPRHAKTETLRERRSGYGIAAVESHTGRIEIIPPIFVVSFTLFSPLNINGHMLSGVMAQEVTTAYNTRVLTLFYCLQISSIVFSYMPLYSLAYTLLSSLSTRAPSTTPALLPLLLHLLHRRILPFPFPLVVLSLIVTPLRSSLSLLFDSLLLPRRALSAPPLCPIPTFFSFFVPLWSPCAYVRIMYIAVCTLFSIGFLARSRFLLACISSRADARKSDDTETCVSRLRMQR